MTNAEKEEAFFQYIKNHPSLSHIDYGEGQVENQQWIGVLVDPTNWTGESNHLMVPGNVVIDPNWDGIYESFKKDDLYKEIGEYIDALTEAADTPKKVANFIQKHALQKIKDSHVIANNVYVVISSNFTKSWFDSILEV